MRDETEREDGAGLPFGEILKGFRLRQHYSQQDLAALLGLHRNTIGKWERGDCLPDTRGTVIEIANQLRLDKRETHLLLQSSLTALELEPVPIWHLPCSRNFFFTGREELLEQLHTLLDHRPQAAQTRAAVLSGMGGIGKTQIAIEYAYRHARDYSALLWVNAESPESILVSLAQIAQALNLPERNENRPQAVVNAVARWLTSHTHWLVIVDDLSNPALVKHFLPSPPHGSWLFTTQRQTLGTMAFPLTVQPMRIDEAVTLLLCRIRKLVAGESTEHIPSDIILQAHQLVKELDGLPLAIDQAGAYIEDTQCSLAEYLELYQRAPLALLDERDAHAEHPASVVRTLRLAFGQIQQRNPVAADLVLTCAFLAAEAIPEETLLRGAEQLGPELVNLASDLSRYQAALKDLLAYSLIRREGQSKMVSIHRLVSMVFKASLSEQQQQHWSRRLVPVLE